MGAIWLNTYRHPFGGTQAHVWLTLGCFQGACWDHVWALFNNCSDKVGLLIVVRFLTFCLECQSLGRPGEFKKRDKTSSANSLSCVYEKTSTDGFAI